MTPIDGMRTIVDRLDLGVLVAKLDYSGNPIAGGMVVDVGMNTSGGTFVIVLDERLGHRFVTMRSGEDVRKSTALPTAGLRRIEADEIGDIREIGHNGIGEYMGWAGRAFTQLAALIGARPRNALTDDQRVLLAAGIYCLDAAAAISWASVARQTAARNGDDL